jgi:hypothetical protein
VAIEENTKGRAREKETGKGENENRGERVGFLVGRPEMKP